MSGTPASEAKDGLLFEWSAGRRLTAIARGLIKRGLLVGDPTHMLRITVAGMAIDVEAQENWKPMRGIQC